ncbi:MAG: molybdopterin oxidoreductase family protein [Phaeodactylibacter sp.]|nr:molybdopterin oxidoreductase family protein [Phaeodactylibacter sp.]MCB9050950.1 molybdopterin oxidoreductase family protein [Lewinellaceae bacterium]
MPTHYRACNLCEAICGLAIEHEDGKILSIRGDEQDPLSRGHICPKAVALQDVYEDPDRLKYPVRRTANGWERIGWEEAFDEVATNLRKVQEKHGPDAVGAYFGNPNVHNLGSMLFSGAFSKALGTKNRFSATSADQLPHHVAALTMFGHGLLLPVPDVSRTHFLLIIGANPLVSNGSMMTAPGFARHMKGIQERGGKVVVVDPRRTETAGKADTHYFIRPGRDALMLLALIHTVLKEELVELRHLKDIVTGLDEVEKIAAGFSPETAAPLVGIKADDIRRLAREFAQAPSAVCYGRMGASTQPFGGLCQWLINVFNILTGNLDREGGAMFTRPAFDQVGFTGSQGKTGIFGRRRTRVSGLPEYSGEFPVAALAEEILTPGEGRIRAMVTVAGNPVLSTPNGNLLDEALAGLEFMVAIDIYINETSRHANIILPTTTGLETEHYDVIFHLLAVHNTAKYSPPLFEKEPEQRHDWQIFQALTERLSGQAGNNMQPGPMLDFALRSGPYKLSLKQLIAEPHGIDLGPLQPCLPGRLFTPDKRIPLAPDIFVQDISRLKAKMGSWKKVTSGDFPFGLIGRRQLRSNNSWMHNAYRLVKGKERCTLLIHPDDAERVGVEEGQEVRVVSAAGAIEIKAELSSEMMPGVVSIPHGWGHSREGVMMNVARAHPGASINDLTENSRIDALTGNAAFSGVPVRVEPVSPALR